MTAASPDRPPACPTCDSDDPDIFGTFPPEHKACQDFWHFEGDSDA